MLNPLSAPENASPPLRLDAEAPSDNGHALAPSPTLSPAITSPTAAAFATRSRSFPLLPSTFHSLHEQRPQLSERDSIFATHYLVPDPESAAATPRPPPTPSIHSKSDVPNFHHDVASPLELSAPKSSQATAPALLSRPKRQPSSIASPTSTDKSLRPRIDAVNETIANSKALGFTTGGRFDDNHAILGRTSTVAAPGSPSEPREVLPRKPNSQHLYHPKPIRMSATWDQSDRHAPNTTAFAEDDTGAGEESTPVERKKRTLSRGHTDEQIEATLASEEPLANARSRKASHYLGLFRENAASLEVKKSKDKSKEALKSRKLLPMHDTPSTERKNLDLSGGVAKDVGTIIEDGWAKETGSVEPSSDLSRNRPATLPHRAGVSHDVLSGQLLSTPPSDVSNTSETEDDRVAQEAVQQPESIEWRSGNTSLGNLPLRLLEEIRNRQSLPIQSEVDLHTTTGELRDDYGPDRADRQLNDRDRPFHVSIPHDSPQESHIHDTGDEDEYESDKEHISSATYYPHKAPSPDIEDTDPDQVSPFESSDDTIKSSDASSLEAIDKEHAANSEDYQEALQDHDHDRHISDIFIRPKLPSGQYPPAKPDSTISSASDSEYESWDDSGRSDRAEDFGVTDGGELTPTATPNANSQFLKSKPRHKPLQAVALKPYKHQVGGHSNVYSFSKQAICKQLNNRENEFYEVIERRHPDLLKFLPRYAISYIYTHPDILS